MDFRAFFRIFVLCLLVLTSTTQVAADATQCGNSASADIVIMLDLTGSSNAGDVTIEKNAAKTLLDFFNSAAIKPFVAVGTFNSNNCDDENGNQCSIDCGSSQARIVSGGGFTDSYGVDGIPVTDSGLYEAINSMPSSGSGFTNIQAAIETSAAKLLSEADALPGGNSRDNYIILISDGNPNVPGYSSSCATCSVCNCPLAEAAGSQAANDAKASGIKIFAIHYEGNGVGGGCPDESGESAGLVFMRDSIASSPAHFYQGNGDLSGVFGSISQALICDDKKDCTQDSCNPDTGFCEFIELDSDGDQQLDCGDLCEGDDSLNGLPCDGGDPDSCETGTYQCSQGLLICTDDANLDDDNGDGFADCEPTPTPTATPTVNPDITVTPEPTVVPDSVDCAGVKNGSAVLDQCGVCNGDGKSCLGCSSKDLTADLLALDGAALSQKQNVGAAVRAYLRSAPKSKTTKAIARGFIQKAQALYVQSWNLTWSLPQVSLSCTNTQFCVQADNSGAIKGFADAVDGLDALLKDVLALIKKNRGGRLTKSDRRYGVNGERLKNESLSISAQIPTLQSVCS